MSTNIRFEDGLNYGVLRSNSPDVIRKIRRHPQVEIIDMTDGIHAKIPLDLLADGILFPENKGLRKIASSGGNGSLHISH